jgi:hypothetical protein
MPKNHSRPREVSATSALKDGSNKPTGLRKETPMSETAIDTSTSTTDAGDTTATDTTTSTTDTGKTFSQADLDRIVADRVSRERAKYGDYADLKKKAAAAMTEQERAVAEAEQRGKTAAQTATSGRLARAEFKAAAAGKVEKDALDGFLEYADLAKFVGDDGEPDTKAIEAVVKKLAGPARAPDFDGGARTSATKTTDMNQLIRQKAGLA